MRRMLGSVAIGVAGAIACGGSVEDRPSSAALTTVAGAAPAPWGTWDLIALDGVPGGRPSTQTFGHLFLELRPDGRAIVRRCTKLHEEPSLVAVRCEDSLAYDCVYGTVAWDGAHWKVDVPDLHASPKTSRGEVAFDDADANVMNVRYILPRYAAGRFVRLRAEEDAPTRACVGP